MLLHLTTGSSSVLSVRCPGADTVRPFVLAFRLFSQLHASHVNIVMLVCPCLYVWVCFVCCYRRPIFVCMLPVWLCVCCCCLSIGYLYALFMKDTRYESAWNCQCNAKFLCVSVCGSEWVVCVYVCACSIHLGLRWLVTCRVRGWVHHIPRWTSSSVAWASPRTVTAGFFNQGLSHNCSPTSVDTSALRMSLDMVCSMVVVRGGGGSGGGGCDGGGGGGGGYTGSLWSNLPLPVSVRWLWGSCVLQLRSYSKTLRLNCFIIK